MQEAIAAPGLGREVRAPLSRRSESALVRAAQRGSAEAVDELFRRHWPAAHRAAWLVVHDAAAAEDIAQEAFLAALRALDRFDRRRPLGPWLHRIVVNRAIDFTRARSLRAESAADAAPEAVAADPQAALDDGILAALVGARAGAARGRRAAPPARLHARRDRGDARPPARDRQLAPAARARHARPRVGESRNDRSRPRGCSRCRSPTRPPRARGRAHGARGARLGAPAPPLARGRHADGARPRARRCRRADPARTGGRRVARPPDPGGRPSRSGEAAGQGPRPARHAARRRPPARRRRSRALDRRPRRREAQPRRLGRGRVVAARAQCRGRQRPHARGGDACRRDPLAPRRARARRRPALVAGRPQHRLPRGPAHAADLRQRPARSRAARSRRPGRSGLAPERSEHARVGARRRHGDRRERVHRARRLAPPRRPGPHAGLVGRRPQAADRRAPSRRDLQARRRHGRSSRCSQAKPSPPPRSRLPAAGSRSPPEATASARSGSRTPARRSPRRHDRSVN